VVLDQEVLDRQDLVDTDHLPQDQVDGLVGVGALHHLQYPGQLEEVTHIQNKLGDQQVLLAAEQ